MSYIMLAHRTVIKITAASVASNVQNSKIYRDTAKEEENVWGDLCPIVDDRCDDRSLPVTRNYCSAIAKRIGHTRKPPSPSTPRPHTKWAKGKQNYVNIMCHEGGKGF